MPDDGGMHPLRLTLAVAFALAVAAALPAQDPPVPSPPAAPANLLGAETSPYLRLHKDNPVHWLPWGEAAFARARQEQKPVFLSIGYAACHWCHVMAKESFVDARIAALLNEHFVCVKVDREERPDVDEIYIAAVQAMGQQPGWPLSVWMTPDKQPFFGGTYFPPEDRFGRPGFRRVLEHLAKAWREDRAELEKGAAELAGHLASVLAPVAAPGEPRAELLARLLPQSTERFDAPFGGFAEPPHHAPKFPNASELQALLRLPDAAALAIVQKSLDAMRRGGIHDQLGGGFHRYSTDRRWLVPHFEKMLYDNAQLAELYLEAFLRTRDGDYAVVARQTLDYLLREMQAGNGGFFATQDAQSEGVEGKFFVWTLAEFEAALGAEAGKAAAAHFGVTAEGNWEGKNVLTLANPGAADVALAAARTRLREVRDRRVRPPTDDKIVCAWNGLTIAALARGHAVLGDPRYLAAARRAADFALRELVADGRCRRSWHSGKAPLAGYLEDQAMLANALLVLFETDSDPRWLAAAKELLAVLVRDFGAEDGSFYFTARDHETLVARSKSVSESSMPSGVAAATQALLRGGLLLGDEGLYERGVAALRANHAMLQRAPSHVASLTVALQFHLADPREVVVAGEPGDPRTQALLAAVRLRFPWHHVSAVVHAGNREALGGMSPVFAGKEPIDGAPAAYVCRRGVCAAPVTDPAELRW